MTLDKRDIEMLLEKGGPSLFKALEACEAYLSNERDDDILIMKGLILEDNNFFGYISKTYGPDDALPCFDEALIINPSNHKGWNAKGNYLLSRSEYNLALKCFDTAIMLNGMIEDYHLNRAYCLEIMEQRGLTSQK